MREIELQMQPEDNRVDNEKVVWDFLAIRRMWSTVVLDHKWVREVLVSIRDERARKHDLFRRIIFLIFSSIFTAEVLWNL